MRVQKIKKKNLNWLERIKQVLDGTRNSILLRMNPKKFDSF